MPAPLARAAASFLPFALALPAQAPIVPLGFTVETLAAAQRGPISLDLLPDGRVLFAEQNGNVKVRAATGAVGLVHVVTGLRVSYSQGLIALAVDPRWPAFPYVYGYHTSVAGNDLRITRWTATGALSDPSSTSLQLGSPFVVLAGIPDASNEHEGGCLRFGPDGFLYASFGDDRDPCASQRLDSLGGKLVRLRVDALPAGAGGPPPRAQLAAPGNPFAGAGDVPQLLWANGLRNPFRFHLDPADGAVFVADVGEDAFDEIDRIPRLTPQPATNCGWPWREAAAAWQTCGGSEPASLAPIFAQAVPSQFLALISLGVYRSGPAAPWWFGPGYEGDYFYADHFTGRIWRLRAGTNGWEHAPPVPGQAHGAPWGTLRFVVDAKVGADGALYFCERGTATSGSIGRIRPSGPAFAPFGVACSPAVLSAQAGSTPALGGTFTVQVGPLPAPPAGSVLGMLGLSKVSWNGTPLPLELSPFGMPGCIGAVSPDHTAPMTNAGLFATWPLALPLAPALAGLDVYVQALVHDPARNPMGLAITNAGEAVVR